MTDAKVAENATVSSQYTMDVLYEQVRMAEIADTQANTGTDIQYGVTSTIHAIENTAARIADTECTLLSSLLPMNAGASATKSNEAGARNARN